MSSIRLFTCSIESHGMVITGEKTNNMFSRMVQRGVTPGHAGHGGPPENCINLRTAGDPMTYFSVGETPTRPSRHGIQNKSRESTAGSRVRASACWSLRSSRAQATGGACAPGWRPLASHVGWPVAAARADPVGWRRQRSRRRRRRRRRRPTPLLVGWLPAWAMAPSSGTAALAGT